MVVYPVHRLYISGCSTEAGEGLWHHAVIINATYFAYLVHRLSLASATITHLFFVVMKASSLPLQTSLIHGFCTLHLVSAILAVPWLPASVGTACKMKSVSNQVCYVYSSFQFLFFNIYFCR